MELNAEQIKKALECCAANDGCVGEECPYYSNCIFGITRIYKDALALINSQEQRIKELAEEIKDLTETVEVRGKVVEQLQILTNEIEEDNRKLTEENEQLRNRVVCNVVIPDEKLEEIKNECLERVELDIKAIQTDTVRKMQERLKAASHIESTITGYRYSVVDVAEIDQIAKEMLGDAE